MSPPPTLVHYQNLPCWWAIGMTTAVWTVAGIGVAAKLFLPGLDKRFWVGLYLALGWLCWWPSADDRRMAGWPCCCWRSAA